MPGPSLLKKLGVASDRLRDMGEALAAAYCQSDLWEGIAFQLLWTL